MRASLPVVALLALALAPAAAAEQPGAAAGERRGVIDRRRCPGRGLRRVGAPYPRGLSVGCIDAAGRRQGRAQQWHATGALAESGSYRDDQREGPWTHFDAEGNRRREERYAADVRQGPVSEWHASGAKAAEYALRDGKREGAFRSWRPDGELAEEGSFVADRRHGRWVTYLGRGEQLEEHWRDGVRDGPVARRRRGKKVEEGRYRAGARDGRWVSYDISADPPLKVREGLYRRGLMHGRWATYLRNGALQTAEHFVDGRRHGHAVSYDLDGNKVSEGTYRRDKRHGRWRFYRGPQGAREEVYVEGQRASSE